MKDMKYSEQDVERILTNSSFTNQEHKDALRARLFNKSSEQGSTKAQIISLFDNKEFVDRLMQTSSEDEIASVFSESNVELSKENISVIKEALSINSNASGAEFASDELSEDELEMVAGGRLHPQGIPGRSALEPGTVVQLVKDFVVKNIL